MYSILSNQLSSIAYLQTRLETVKRNGNNSEEDRIIVAMCCKMTGIEKMNLVVIGKSKQLRAVRKANTKQMKSLYCNN